MSSTLRHFALITIGLQAALNAVFLPCASAVSAANNEIIQCYTAHLIPDRTQQQSAPSKPLSGQDAFASAYLKRSFEGNDRFISFIPEHGASEVVARVETMNHLQGNDRLSITYYDAATRTFKGRLLTDSELDTASISPQSLEFFKQTEEVLKRTGKQPSIHDGVSVPVEKPKPIVTSKPKTPSVNEQQVDSHSLGIVTKRKILVGQDQTPVIEEKIENPNKVAWEILKNEESSRPQKQEASAYLVAEDVYSEQKVALNRKLTPLDEKHRFRVQLQDGSYGDLPYEIDVETPHAIIEATTERNLSARKLDQIKRFINKDGFWTFLNPNRKTVIVYATPEMSSEAVLRLRSMGAQVVQSKDDLRKALKNLRLKNRNGQAFTSNE